MQRQVYKIVDCPTPFEKSPWVNYRGDMYVGEDGDRYEVTKHPHMVDATRLLHSCTNTKGDISLRQGIGLEPPATSRELKGPGVSTNPFKMLDDYAHKIIDKPKVTTRFAFETRHRVYTKEIPIWSVF